MVSVVETWRLPVEDFGLFALIRFWRQIMENTAEEESLYFSCVTAHFWSNGPHWITVRWQITRFLEENWCIFRGTFVTFASVPCLPRSATPRGSNPLDAKDTKTYRSCSRKSKWTSYSSFHMSDPGIERLQARCGSSPSSPGWCWSPHRRALDAKLKLRDKSALLRRSGQKNEPIRGPGGGVVCGGARSPCSLAAPRPLWTPRRRGCWRRSDRLFSDERSCVLRGSRAASSAWKRVAKGRQTSTHPAIFYTNFLLPRLDTPTGAKQEEGGCPRGAPLRTKQRQL